MASGRKKLAFAVSVAVLSVSGLVACGSVRPGPPPPPPRSIVERPVDARRIFSGVWYGYGRIRSRAAPACTPEAIEFRGAADGDLFERDFCRNPRGARRQTEGRLDIENPGLDTKYVMRERVMAGFYVPKEFVILSHGPNYHWFIRSEPAGELVVFTRDAVPASEIVKRVQASLVALGVDPERLEAAHPEADLEVLKSEALRP